MRPEYGERIKTEFKDGSGGFRTSTFRVTRTMFNELNIYADHEQDSVSNLLREGIMRVIDDRRDDGNYMAGIDPDKFGSLYADARAKAEELQSQLEIVQAQLDVFGSRQQSDA